MVRIIEQSQKNIRGFIHRMLLFVLFLIQEDQMLPGFSRYFMKRSSVLAR
jgi:hypothetical protein